MNDHQIIAHKTEEEIRALRRCGNLSCECNSNSGKKHCPGAQEHALSYLHKGYSVIPLARGTKKSLVKWKQYQGTPPTEQEIKWWFQQWPDANVGIITGLVSGIFVVDVDSSEGLESLKALGGWEDVPDVTTSKVGHYYFIYPDEPIRNAAGILPGVDIRGEGGLVAAPPSIHHTGVLYEWTGARKLGEAPSWLLELLREKATPSPVDLIEPQRSLINGAMETPDQARRFVAGCVRSEVSKIQNAPDGTKHQQLLKSSKYLAGYIPTGAITAEEIQSELYAAVAQRAADKKNALDTIKDGIEYGKSAPLAIPPRQLPGQRARRAKAKPILELARDREKSISAGNFPLNEVGNGKHFAAKYGSHMRFCSVRAQWLAHKDGRWGPDETGEAEQGAKEIARDAAVEAGRATEDDQRARLLKHALTLTKRATRETMLKDAASEPGMMVTPEQFDANPNLLNLANGTFDLSNFEFYAWLASDLLSLQSRVAFDANAQCPTWLNCLERWVPDKATRDYIQDSVGVSLSGKVFEEFFNFLYGGGDNGKSTFLRVVEQICGDYWHKTQAETIMQSRDKRAPEAPAPALLALKGARLVTVHEIDRTHILNSALIKDLTGRDAITARGLFEKRPTTFEPQFTLWMFGNGKPQIRDTSGGMWRRVRLIDFNQPIPREERDPQLSDKLRAELPGILNWALEGLKRVQDRGLIVPEAVKAATDEYQAEQDPFAGFVADCCIVGPEYKAATLDLWEAWGHWCTQNGERVGSQRALGNELKRRKFMPGKSGSTRHWEGIGLIAKNGTQGTQETQLPVKSSTEKSHVQTSSENVSDVYQVSQNGKIPVNGYGND